MRKIFTLVAGVALLATASPAFAHIVEVTTTVSLEEVEDRAALEQAVHEAVVGVIRNTIAFKPTFVALTQARVVGERLVMRLMLVDEDGERLLNEFTEGSGGGASPGGEGLPGQDGGAPARSVDTRI
jgi:hypothetical protein